MAILATAQIALQIHATVLTLRIVHFESDVAAAAVDATKLHDSAGGFLLVTNNLVTDGLFTYRCFIVWGRNIRVAAAPMLMLLTTTVLGYLSSATHPSQDGGVIVGYLDFWIPFDMILATNVILTGLTAGRIWWIRRDARVLEPADVQKYDTAIAMILESGAIYCLTILLYLLLSSTNSSPNAQKVTAVLYASLPQIMNIAPTTMIVRVGLDRLKEHGQHLREPGA
ncbi:hypothetical protein DFH06DRAFT_1446031 [Mycena polygramma]|nr:hypothetical protein DFH06DRAFT_1446031 [Mycena polygramma]